MYNYEYDEQLNKENNGVLFVVLVVVTIYLYLYNGECRNFKFFESFTSRRHIKENLTNDNRSKYVFLYMNNCTYCKKMKEILTNGKLFAKFNWVPVDSSIGQNLARKYKPSGFPAFINKKNGNLIVGYTPDIKKLVGTLNK